MTESALLVWVETEWEHFESSFHKLYAVTKQLDVALKTEYVHRLSRVYDAFDDFYNCQSPQLPFDAKLFNRQLAELVSAYSKLLSFESMLKQIFEQESFFESSIYQQFYRLKRQYLGE